MIVKILVSIRSRKFKRVQNYDTTKLFVRNNLQYIPKEGLTMDASASAFYYEIYLQ